jgi:hypothetical protein
MASPHATAHIVPSMSWNTLGTIRPMRRLPFGMTSLHLHDRWSQKSIRCTANERTQTNLGFLHLARPVLAACTRLRATEGR